MSLAEQLSAGLADLNIQIPQAGQDKLIQYVDLLVKWNRVHNLTAVRDAKQMIPQHLLDSLVILPFVNECKTLVDVGSGGGLPGIPLAIARADLAVTLLDSSHNHL